MTLSKTDAQNLVRYLNDAETFYRTHRNGNGIRELERARKLHLISSKLQSKLLDEK